jgi:hypothetical protein
MSRKAYADLANFVLLIDLEDGEGYFATVRLVLDRRRDHRVWLDTPLPLSQWVARWGLSSRTAQAASQLSGPSCNGSSARIGSH